VSTGSRPALPAERVDVVVARGVTKRFGRLRVLRGVDLTIPPGRITGLVGPNAAGKTTFIKAILGLVRPDAGYLSVLGHSVNGDERYRRAIGYMPQTARFPENLTGAEVLEMVRDLRGPGQVRDLELLERFGLEQEIRKPVRTLSGGTRQKLSAAVAFLFRPALLILDEPTAGLDPVASGQFKEKLLAARERGASALLASHTLSELEELADDVVFLLDGCVRFHGSLPDLMQLTGFARLEKAIAALMLREGA
jgi:Cu-processing system ATP-binding protein